VQPRRRIGRFRLDELAYADTAGWLTAIAARRGQGETMATPLHGLLAYMLMLARRWSVPRRRSIRSRRRRPVIAARQATQ